MPHGRHNHKTALDMEIATMCDFPSYKNDLTHWKFVLFCFSKYPSIVNPYQELHSNTKNACPSIRFHVYKAVFCSTVHGQYKFEEKGICVLFSTVLPENSNRNFDSRKELVLMETSIYDFHKKLYIPEIQKLSSHLPNTCIIGTQNFGK